jgi:hypothetical protein
MPRPASHVRVSLISTFGCMSGAFDLHVILLPALEEQLVTSHHEEAARLQGFIVAEDHERAVMAGIQQGAGVALAAS